MTIPVEAVPIANTASAVRMVLRITSLRNRCRITRSFNIWSRDIAHVCRPRDELRQNASRPAGATESAICYGDMEPAPHILVVDDDREIRDLLARFLVEKHQMR